MLNESALSQRYDANLLLCKVLPYMVCFCYPFSVLEIMG